MAEKEYIEREAIEVLAEDRLSSYHDKLVMELLFGNDFSGTFIYRLRSFYNHTCLQAL